MLLLLLVYYVASTLYLVMRTTDHDSTVLFGSALKYIIVPLTILGLTLITLRSRLNAARAKELGEQMGK